MKAFTQKPFSEVYEPTMEPFNVVNSVEMKGVEKYLVVRSSVFMEKRMHELTFFLLIWIAGRSRCET
jgi:hypothetical protein